LYHFFVGSAVFLGLRYFWPHKCKHEIGGSVILDHPPNFSHHDHIPYALDHSYADASSYADITSYDTSSYEPYSSYVPPTSEAGPSPSSGRSLKKDRKVRSVQTEARQKHRPEEQIADFMFVILGVDSNACRRRFICEMEFRSRENPLTSMAFRIIGRGFFSKYTNNQNAEGPANNFAECALVNPDCVFIEQDIDDEQTTEEQDVEVVSADESNAEAEPEQVTEKINALYDKENEIEKAEKMSNFETANTNNLKAEMRLNSFRDRGDRKFKTIFDHIMQPRN